MKRLSLPFEAASRLVAAPFFKRIIPALIVLICAVSIRSTAWSQGSISQQIEALVSQYDAVGVESAIVVEDLENSKIVFSHNAESLLNPASNMKILTTLAALTALGPDFTFKTQLLASGKEGAGSYQSLALKGSGDPAFTSLDLQSMVARLKSEGVRRVGKVLLDDSCFDRSSFPGRFESRQRDAAFNATVGGLAIDGNILEVEVSPAERAGLPAEVSLVPPLPSFPFKGEVHTGGKGRGRIVVKNDPSGADDLSVSVQGSIPLKSPPLHYRISHEHPTEVTGLRLLEFLKEAGIAAPAQVETGVCANKSDLKVEHLSPPLREIIQEINKKSNNFMAEQLTQALGQILAGGPGNTKKGIAAIQKQLKSLGLDLAGTFLENGSGLSKNTRIRARTLVDVLQAAFQNSKLKQDFLSSLSVLGVDGTLHRRYRRSDLQGFFAGKTGTMNGVTSLSGYVFRRSAPERAPYLLAFIANGSGKGFWQQKELQGKILEVLINQ